VTAARAFSTTIACELDIARRRCICNKIAEIAGFQSKAGIIRHSMVTRLTFAWFSPETPGSASTSELLEFQLTRAAAGKLETALVLKGVIDQ
jgi:hypothetical protein